jgi:outer membrane immunogenic protein
MKPIAMVAAIAIAGGFAQAASAADMLLKASEFTPTPMASWTGFYVGVHGGAGWQSSKNWNYFDATAAAGLINLRVNTPLQAASNNLGGIGGIQGGYNWQFAPAWVVGIEGDISWASLADHRSSPMFLGTGFPGGLAGTAIDMSANTEWLSSVRGKFGFVGWNTLWYVTGGAAWVNIEYTATATFLPFQSNASFNTTKSGWVLGGGAEWQATSNILLRAEYLYYNINNGNVSASQPFNNTVVFPLAPTFTWANYNVQVARVAASYKF